MQDINKEEIFARDVRLLAFDADDTLWDCQGHFDAVERRYCEVLAPWGGSEEVSKALFNTETANMPLLGYGSKAFTISLVENAIKFTHGEIDGDRLLQVIDLGKTLLNMPATPLPGVVETLRLLRESGRYKMVVFTKGDNLDQEAKFHRSGLSEFFDDYVVVADKTKHEYAHLCDMFRTGIGRLCMVGNSYKSDILPVLQLGGWAVHIPYKLVWKMEETEEAPHPRLLRVESFRQLERVFI